MSNFANIGVSDMAIALSKESPDCAVDHLAHVAQHKRQYSLDLDVVTWQATSLAIRHGLLLEWMAGEMTA